ncbi:MAG: 16S rRNA (uracil(1498)-N(3))-methyltransferase [Gammaproteobacteria bacterium]|jgi:16S rRNA (uracil1498-N3)-methyltransferase|nr:16S rRNA (uracil(1498)-N(3))-methyltransferase [Gammaproteobacteria bacterium]
MREIRVYVDSLLESGRRVALNAQAAQHVTKVLRLRDGATLRVFNGRGGEYPATLRIAGREVSVELGDHRAVDRESPIRVVLLQALARGERMDFVIQKATELGVHRIIPVAAARSVVQLDADRGDKRTHHWQAVAAAACEQSGRNTLPIIDSPLSFEAALTAVIKVECRLLLLPEATASLAGSLTSTAPTQEIALLVGPEGGLEETEVERALEVGFRAVRLGPRVLRTETAGLAALSALQCLAGDFA